MKTGVFITGTDTGVGKTLAAAMLLAAARTQGLDAAYFKPVQTGDECDCSTVKMLTGVEATYIIKPVYSFVLPQAPYRAAHAANCAITIETIVEYWRQLAGSYYLIEGAGGLLVPLTHYQTIRDLVTALELPLLIVASTRLGTINHTLLTLEAAAHVGIPVKGLILSGPADPGLTAALQQFAAIPVIAEIPALDNDSYLNFQNTATKIFPSDLLRSLLS